VFSTGETHKAEGAEVRHRFPPNNELQTRYLDFIYAPIFDEEGRIDGIFCTGVDVTEARAAHAAREESEARFRNVADHAPVMMWVTDADGVCTYLNRRWYEFTGQTPEEALGFGWLDTTHPDDREAAEAAFLTANAKREPFRLEYRLRRADGAYRWSLDAASPRFSPSGEYLGYVGSVIDIDERREATEHAEVGFWDVDVIDDRLIWPSRVKALFGISADAAVSMQDFYDGLHPEDRERTAAAYAAAADPAIRALYDVEYRTLGKEDGVVRWVAAKGRGVFDDNGRCLRMIGTAVDVTERKSAESARDLLMREVDHRARNALTVLQSVVRLTDSSNPNRFREAINGRVDAIARAQATLSRTNWRGGGLDQVARDELLSVTSDGRFSLDGPDLEIGADQVQPLSMVLHELATNATKYGALSNADGRVAVTWTRRPGGWRLAWREHGGPAVVAPSRKGFGSRLITRLAEQLRATVIYDWDVAGLQVILDADAAGAGAEASPTAPHAVSVG
jgi:PAS domain S-box-containing protein